MGVKACINGNFSVRTLEKIKKGRRAFYSVLGLGIKNHGLNMNTCNLLFWSLIVPITLFGSEILVLQDQDVYDLDCFQRQVGRRIQRFYPRSPDPRGMDAIGNHDLCKKGYFSEDNFSNGRAVDL